MEEFVRGPLVWISAVIFVAGFIYRGVKLFRLTEKKVAQFCPAGAPKDTPASAVSKEEARLEKIARLENSVLFRHPMMIAVSAIFHVFVFVAPIFLVAHNVLFENAFGISLPGIPDGLADFMTVVVLFCGMFFLLRRIVLPRVAAISSGYDYVVLLVAIMPFFTGFLAYHQLFDYETMLTVHIVSGEIMLIALPFTKIGHMVFFFFARLSMSGEHSLGRGNRTWSN